MGPGCHVTDGVRDTSSRHASDLEDVRQQKTAWFHVLVGLLGMGLELTLCGLAVASHYYLTDFTKAAIIVVQGLAVSLHIFEMLMMSQDIGERGTDRRSPEPAPAAATASTLKGSLSRMTQLVYNQSDLIMLITLALESLGFIIVSQKVVSKAYILLIQWSFALLVACRTIKTLQKRLVLLVHLWDMADMLNQRMFNAYDNGWAYITAEEEAMAKARSFWKATELANNIRDLCRLNKLQMLLKMMDIQHKCPDVKVATTASKVVRRALRKAYDDLGDLHECLKIDDMQFQALKQELVRMLQSVDRMPTNFIVGDTVHCVLLSIPWLPWEEVINIHKEFFVTLKKGDQLTNIGYKNKYVDIICSGIVFMAQRTEREIMKDVFRMPTQTIIFLAKALFWNICCRQTALASSDSSQTNRLSARQSARPMLTWSNCR